MGNSVVSQKIVTPVCRLAYPNIFTADKDGKYSAVLLFEKQGFDPTFMRTIVDEIKGQLQTSTFKQGFPATFKGNPLKDGDVPNSMGNTPFAGFFYCNVKSNFQPGVVASFPDPVKKGADGRPLPMIIEDSREIYGGVYARVSMHAYYYNSQGNLGIGLSLNSVQKIKDGEQLGGASNPANDFDCYETNEITDASGVVNNVDAMMGGI